MNFMIRKYLLLVCSVFYLTAPEVFAQFTSAEYNKALWMTTRMYGGQRSGAGPNWLVMDHNVSNNGETRNGVDFVNDNDQGYDLSGGWHDCGDHVKFGQTQYYSAYVLLLGYEAFPTGYDDMYSFDYSGYQSSGDFTWEGQTGEPNGIPDILDEVKYATDYFIKCARDGETFYSQVGNGTNDHKQWVTSPFMATLSAENGGEPREVLKNPNDASMASFCGATLALMSRMYRQFDETYADLCLQHAEYAYAYANSRQSANGGTITGDFYGSDNDWRDNYVCLTAELYYATGNVDYRDEALSYAVNINENGWVLDYENSQDLALYQLMKLGDDGAKTRLESTHNNYKNAVNGEGVMDVGGNWGKLRYAGSAAYSIALYEAYHEANTVDGDIRGTVDYILGDNSANQSFVVGFGNKAPQEPHHRNVFLNDQNDMATLSIPQRNAQHGFMVGGTSNPGDYQDDVDYFQHTEGCIDYQSGLVGALAFIRSIEDPVDTSKFSNVTSVHALDENKDFYVYPNPAKDELFIAFEQLQMISTQSLEAIDMQGKAHQVDVHGNGNIYSINTGHLEKGTYLIQLTNKQDQRISFKVHKQ